MGYRSDVRIITSLKGFKKLTKYVAINTKENSLYNLMEHIDFIHKNDYSVYFGWNNIKWYFDDAETIMNGLNYLRDNEYSYRFARLGEDYDDYEEKYYESEKEEEQDMEYPSLERHFDDNYVIENMGGTV